MQVFSYSVFNSYTVINNNSLAKFIKTKQKELLQKGQQILLFKDSDKTTSFGEVEKIKLKKKRMKRQRNTTQMKEQTRNTEVQINEEEIGKLPEKEFRIMIARMLYKVPGGKYFKRRGQLHNYS